MRPCRNVVLAVIGNCEVAALIDGDATIVYWIAVERRQSRPWEEDR